MRETVYDDGSASEVLERDETDLSGALVRDQESESGGSRTAVQIQREGDVEMTEYIITEEQLKELEDGYVYAQAYEVICIGKMVRSRPYQNQREKVLDELRDFDRWFSGRHVGGQSPIIVEVRQELHRRMAYLRGEQG